jgi:hypothetical protein
MLDLEEECYMMGPIIDKQLQKIDQKHAVLENLNLKVFEAFQFYNNLMKESIEKTTNSLAMNSSLMAPQIPSLPVNNNSNSLNSISFSAAPPDSSINTANQLNAYSTNYYAMSRNPPI